MSLNRLLVSILCFIILPLGSVAFTKHWQYIIVGAGPSGVQFGYFLHKAQHDYVILERSNIPGSFFSIYPRHDKLISINKRHTGKTNKEFNLRHDWNSLLSDDESLKFGRYSKDFFPHRETYLTYIKDFVNKYELNVIYDTDIGNISQNNGSDEYKFTMQDQHGNIFTCNFLIIATGMWQPNVPDMPGLEFADGYETVSTNPQDFEGQTVLILGHGNAAFEVADRIYGSTNFIHLIGRSRIRLSWSTHYVGDIRGVNNAFLDTYQLKSLDGVAEHSVNFIKIVQNASKLHLQRKNSESGHENLFAGSVAYDRIIRCLGFRFNNSLFSSDIHLSHGKRRLSKYPKIGHDYESVDVPGMFFVGTATHSLDFRKSAGGFIHGFRYTSRALHRLLEWKNHGIPWPSKSGSIFDLIPAIFKRINEASGIYQMFGMLGDVIAIKGDTYNYYEEFPVNLLPEFEKYTGASVDQVIVMMLEYGANFSGPGEDTFRLSRALVYPPLALFSNFLHPVFYFYEQLPSEEAMNGRQKWEVLPRPDKIHHVVESFTTDWHTLHGHILPFRRFLENIIGKDVRYFPAEDCLVLGLTQNVLPPQCEHHQHQALIFDMANDM